MLTSNEQKTIRVLYDRPDASLRGIARFVELAGVASAAYVVNSLERKGYLKKVGKTTSKNYILTSKAKKELINIPKGNEWEIAPILQQKPAIPGEGTTSHSQEDYLNFWPNNSADSTKGNSQDDSLSFANLILSKVKSEINTKEGWSQNGPLIVRSCLTAFLVFPVTVAFLKNNWLYGFISIMFILFIIDQRKR